MIGFTINGKHSYRDYGIILQNPYQLTPPIPKTHYISVPGRSGDLDLTEALTGKVEYENRILTLELGGMKADWLTFFTTFLNDVHGKEVQMIFDHDTAHYFIGRATVLDHFEKVARLGVFAMEVVCEPYRYDVTPYTYAGTVTSQTTVTVPQSKMPVIPEVVCTIATGNTLTVTNNGKTCSLKNGMQKLRELEMTTDWKLVFKGSGSISVTARGGCL